MEIINEKRTNDEDEEEEEKIEESKDEGEGEEEEEEKNDEYWRYTKKTIFSSKRIV